MDISCELPNLDCLQKPTKADIERLKGANIVPDKLITSIFKDLDTNYTLLKHSSKGKSKGTQTKSKGKSTKSKSKSTQTKGGRRTMRKSMRGGELTKYQKDKITDMVILLVAGSSYWLAVPMLESWIIAIGILPKLCGQNMFEHVASTLLAPAGQSCSARAQRYNNIMTGFVTLISGSAWYQRNKFTKENLTRNYKKIHHFVKKTIFGRGETPTPPTLSPRPVTPPLRPLSPPLRQITPRPRSPRQSSPDSRSGRSRQQEQAYEYEEQELENYPPQTTRKGTGRNRK